MATTIFFNGRVISVPGSYSEVDASGLESVGLGAAGIVAVLGTAEGGKPVSEITETKDFIRCNTPEKVRKTFRSGDLREVGDMLFAPAKDADIKAGAQELVCMKINPATASAAVLPNAYGDALDLVSKDYGAFTEQLNIQIASGTNQGKRVIIQFEDTTEAGDDIGGTGLFTLKYTKPTNGWDGMNAQVISGGGIKCLATRAQLGLDSEITDLVAPGVIEVVSANAADVGQKVTILGLDGTGAAQREVLTLNGTSAVIGTQAWAASGVLGAYVSTGTTAGIVTVRASPGGATVMSLPAGTGQTTAKGLKLGVCMYAAGVMTLVANGATTKTALVLGLDSTGAIALEKFVLNGLVPVAGLAVFSSITAIVLGDVEAARTITIAGTAAWAKPTVQKTLIKAMDYFNARAITGTGGFTFAMLTGLTTLSLEYLDVMASAVTILDPANPEFNADLFFVEDWINNNSQFIAASRSAGAYGGAPSNTAAPVFLAGGSEGTAIFDDWQNALNLLKKTRINTIVVLTADPAVHAALDAHCAYMGGIGRSERDGVVGLMNGTMTDLASKDDIKTQIMALNTRHLRAVAQAIERYNTAGERQEFTPPFHAAIIAGMQAGAPVGTPLTHKYTNTLSFRQSNTWNPTDDAEEMIQAGLCFLETVEGVGRRVVRNVTTHLSSNNIAYVEASVNQAVNYAVFNFRTNMEFLVGKKGFAGTINAGQSVAINTLGLLVDAQVLVTYRSLALELIVDTMEVSVEIAPVIPINFVKNTIHLVTVRQSAA